MTVQELIDELQKLPEDQKRLRIATDKQPPYKDLYEIESTTVHNGLDGINVIVLDT